MLKQQLIPSFKRDVKKLMKRHYDTDKLREVMLLILENSTITKKVLKQRHNMHKLKEEWAGSFECHVANVGDWLLIWCIDGDYAIFQRTGTHDDLFR